MEHLLGAVAGNLLRFSSCGFLSRLLWIHGSDFMGEVVMAEILLVLGRTTVQIAPRICCLLGLYGWLRRWVMLDIIEDVFTFSL